VMNQLVMIECMRVFPNLKIAVGACDIEEIVNKSVGAFFVTGVHLCICRLDICATAASSLAQRFL